jgi:hypothetical protein
VPKSLLSAAASVPAAPKRPKNTITFTNTHVGAKSP